MISYETYCRIRLIHQEHGLNFSQIGRELGLDPETAAKYAALDTFPPRRRATQRASKLDAFKPAISGSLVSGQISLKGRSRTLPNEWCIQN